MFTVQKFTMKPADCNIPVYFNKQQENGKSTICHLLFSVETELQNSLFPFVHFAYSRHSFSDKTINAAQSHIQMYTSLTLLKSRSTLSCFFLLRLPFDEDAAGSSC